MCVHVCVCMHVHQVKGTCLLCTGHTDGRARSDKGQDEGAHDQAEESERLWKIPGASVGLPSPQQKPPSLALVSFPSFN